MSLFQLSDYQSALQARLTGLDRARFQIAQHGNDVDTLALTLFGEGRGESLDGRVAIAWTVLNRVKAKGGTVTDRCLQRLQYSTWWIEGGQENYRRTLDVAERVVRGMDLGIDGPVIKECRYLASGVMGELLRDRTHGATHYYVATMSNPPAWANGETGTLIGSHIFFGGIAW